MGVPLKTEPQQTAGPGTGVVYPDPGATDDRTGGLRLTGADREAPSGQVDTVLGPVDLHGPTETTRTVSRTQKILNRLHGADQHCGSVAFSFGHDVHAGIHPVDQIDVCVAGRPEHDPGPGGDAPGGMGGLVVGAQIGLDFYDPPDPDSPARPVDEKLTEEFPGHGARVPVIERPSQRIARIRRKNRFLAVQIPFPTFSLFVGSFGASRTREAQSSLQFPGSGGGNPVRLAARRLRPSDHSRPMA